jgi:hypothetical protein
VKVVCLANSGEALTSKYLAIGNSVNAEFNVIVGREYIVFAIAVYQGVTLFLLNDNNGHPNWYPVDLFSISDARVPEDWFGASYSTRDSNLQFLLGYQRMIDDESHYDALLERSPAALEWFRMEREKAESPTSHKLE